MDVQDGRRQVTDSCGIAGRPPSGPLLHRLAAVRRAQKVSLQTLAKRLDMDVAEVRRLEEEGNDMALQTLHRWAAALEVPAVELLSELDDELSPPVMWRATAVRMMKTVRAIRRHGSPRVRRLARSLIGQLLEMMPELKDVQPWPSVGEGRHTRLGRIALHVVRLEELRAANGVP